MALEEEFDIEIPMRRPNKLQQFNKLWTISVTKLLHPLGVGLWENERWHPKLKALAFAPTPKILKFNTFYVLPYG